MRKVFRGAITGDAKVCVANSKSEVLEIGKRNFCPPQCNNLFQVSKQTGKIEYRNRNVGNDSHKNSCKIEEGKKFILLAVDHQN